MDAQTMVGHLIRRLHQKSTHVFTKQTKDAGFDLTSVQFAAMDAIQSHPGIDQARIAALIAYDKATIGGVIDRLEHKGYLTRRVNERDRRAREVNLTPEGQQIFDAILPIVQALQTDILSRLDQQERETVFKLLQKAAGLE